MAGWSSSAPSGVSFGTAKESGNWSLTQGHALYTAAIARGANNTIYIKVDFKKAPYDGFSSYNISMTANVGGSEVTVSAYWGKYSASYDTFATRYYTGTAEAGATVSVSVTLAGAERRVSLTAPAYTTKYTISYNANGGSGTTAAQTKTYATALTLRQSGFTRDGFAFLHWNTKADGTGTTYAAGASYTANAAVTLYAIWKKLNIPVFVNVDGTIRQVEKAYANVGGAIKECAVYVNVAGVIKALT